MSIATQATDPAFFTGYHQVRRYMETAYPAVFTPRKTPPVPLALGVGVQLMAELTELFGERSAKVFMAGWTHRREYRWAVLTGNLRYALDGSVSGEITERERDHARDQLVRFYAAQYAKRKTRIEEVGNPARKFRELADHDDLRLQVIERAKELIVANPANRKLKNEDQVDG